MKKLLLAIAVVMSLGAQAQSYKLMSYNIRNGLGMDNQRDLSRVAKVIRKAKADAVAVEELDSVAPRTGRIFVLEELARECGYKFCYAPAIPYQGGKYGIGMLFKEEPVSVHQIPLPGTEEKRTMLIVEFKDFIYCATHLSLTEADRMKSVELLKQEARRMQTDKPLFLAGDFNAHPDSPFIQSLKADFNILTDETQKTFPADNPKSTIDYICQLKGCGRPVKVLKRKVIDEPMASDHRPVIVKIK